MRGRVAVDEPFKQPLQEEAMRLEEPMVRCGRQPADDAVLDGNADDVANRSYVALVEKYGAVPMAYHADATNLLPLAAFSAFIHD